MTKAVEHHKPVLVALESRKKESGEDGHVLQYYIVLKRSFKKKVQSCSPNTQRKKSFIKYFFRKVFLRSISAYF